MSGNAEALRPWQRDKRWADRFLPEIKAALGVHLFGEASEDDDRHRATDLIVLKLEAVRVAVRIRRHAYLERYPDEFTIRAERPSGQETELAKVLSGWGDFLFYGFANAEETGLAAWRLLDLKVFRLAFHRQIVALPAGRFPGSTLDNPDGSGRFLAFNLADFPAELVIAKGARSAFSTTAEAR